MKGSCTISFIGVVRKTMRQISCSFHRRRRTEVDAARVRPEQHVVNDFPLLRAGPTPSVPLDQWTITVDGAVDQSRTWSWPGHGPFQRMMSRRRLGIAAMSHCVGRLESFESARVGRAWLTWNSEPAPAVWLAACGEELGWW
jgi:hypothetical protein